MKRASTESMKVLSDKKAYVGIDVHKESWHVTVRTDGEEAFNGRTPASYHSLMKLLAHLPQLRKPDQMISGSCV